MKQRTAAADYVLIIAGSFIMGYAIKNIYDPANLVTGGASGLAIVVKELAGIPLWLTNTILNIPLFLAAWKIQGWRFIKRTLVATMALSLSLYVIPERVLIPSGDMLLIALFGGIITGVGTGMVFLAQATTGGTDMLAALIQKKFPHYTLPQVLQVLDALIAIYALSKVSDGILEGLKFSKMVYIISDESEQIARSVMEEMGRGVTGLDATGLYSGTRRQMLCCVVSKKEISRLKELVREQDRKAFVIVSDVREVLGEGFIEY